jgi:hypothetical protein
MAESLAGWQRPAQPAASAPAASVMPAAQDSLSKQNRQAPPPAASSSEKLAPVAFNKDDFKKDPLIQRALEIFKGQIVEVRA